jgi:hypothetical protein
MHEGAQGQAVIPRAREIGDVNALVAACFSLAPLQQCIAFRAAIPNKRPQRVLGSYTENKTSQIFCVWDMQ